MTKADLTESVASKADLARAVAERAVTVLFDDIVDALRTGDKVTIAGFGTFTVATRKARTGRNPKTGESIEIPESRAAKFKPGKSLKEALGD